VYGYDRIPETRLADALPPQRANLDLEREEIARDLLTGLGLQEVATYRLTSPEREARRLLPSVQPDDIPYVRLANPIASDRVVMRHSLLASLLEVAERNARLRERLAIFEIAPVFLASEDGPLPDENLRLGIVLSGPRSLAGWQPADNQPMDFFDLKGVVEGLLDGLHIPNVGWEPAAHPTFHPGRCARLIVGEHPIGLLGELHPQVTVNYDFPDRTVLAADFDLRSLINAMPVRYDSASVPAFPPVLEDLALIVDEDLPAGQVESLIRQTGGKLVSHVRLFDVYRGGQTGAGKKSLAYSLTYQALDRTLTDKDVAAIRQKIIRRLEQELGAKLRS
jgi:phenylalanyl-tRNA synthetase beta chain